MKRRGRGEMLGPIRLCLSEVDGSPQGEACLIVETRDGECIGVIQPLFVGAKTRSANNIKHLDHHVLLSIVSHIEESFAGDFQIERLAIVAGISLHNFCRRFKATTDYSPYAFVTAIRMIWAKWLLLSSSLSVEEVADQVGISNVGYFRKQFRKHFYLNPSSVRCVDTQDCVTPISNDGRARKKISKNRPVQNSCSE